MSPSHRLSLTTFLAALATAPLAAQLPQKELAITELAAGVYAAVWTDSFANPIEGNALFIINDDDVVVVDSAFFPSSARRMIAELEKLTDKPVRYLINTHWHDDHHNGNFLYRERWPDVAIVGHVATRENIIEHAYKPRPGVLAEYEKTAAKYARWAETGRRDDDHPLSEAGRKQAGELAVLYRAMVAEMGAAREMPSDLTFEDRLVLHRGARTIEVRWLGRGNTAGDTVVFLPKERIVASGDLLVHPIPFCFGSYYREWIDTLAALDGLAADVIMPGHGPLLKNRDYLHEVQGLLRAIVAETGKAAEEGLTLEQAKQRIRLPDWRKRLAGDDARLGNAFDSFVLAPAIERAFRQAKGEDPPEGRDGG